MNRIGMTVCLIFVIKSIEINQWFPEFVIFRSNFCSRSVRFQHSYASTAFVAAGFSLIKLL